MKAKNLHELLQNSTSTRRYFTSLPVDLQMILHTYNDSIYSAEMLHTYVHIFQKQRVLYKEK